jgi:hypothetical protein
VVVNSNYGATISKCEATKVAAENLIPQINSQCKLAMLRRENRNILQEIEILKANKYAPEGVAT